ncbi:hypothetical protein BDV18DRAFT_160366 [Aspergillus unguis]
MPQTLEDTARCDAFEKSPCSRCERMGIDCVFSEGFRREHKRLKYEQLERETNELREQLSAQAASTPAVMFPAESVVSGVMSDITQGVASGAEYQLPFANPGADALPTLAVATLEASNDPTLADLVPGSIYKNTTSGQIRPQPMQPPVGNGLGGVTLTGDEIDEIYNLFYRQYAHFMPVLDTESPPNETFEQSEFLFWAIVGTASRTCAKNPTLFPALVKPIINLAFLSPLTSTGPWNVVQGLLLVLNWPFPREEGGIDIIFPLTGSLLHLAMQHGMHNPVSSHQFYKTKQSCPDVVDINRRSELWAYTMITYQRVSLMKGQPPRTIPDMAHDIQQRKALYQNMSPYVRTRVKAQEVVTQCGAAVNEYGVLNLAVSSERGLDLILQAYEQRVNDLHVDSPIAMARFDVLVANLCVQGMHFLKNDSLYADNRLRKMNAAACAVINAVEEMSRELETLAVCPSQVWFGLLLASSILLRIIKGYDTGIVDFEKAREYFMKALNLAKLMIVNTSDMPTKIVSLMGHLYHSTRAFRKPDGDIMIQLRIRSRLALCPIIDAMWWFKDEFEPPLTFKPVIPPEGRADHPPSFENCAVLYNDQFWTDLEWALNIPD